MLQFYLPFLLSSVIVLHCNFAAALWICSALVLQCYSAAVLLCCSAMNLQCCWALCVWINSVYEFMSYEYYIHTEPILEVLADLKISWQSGHIQRGMNLKAAAGIKSIAQWDPIWTRLGSQPCNLYVFGFTLTLTWLQGTNWAWLIRQFLLEMESSQISSNH